MVVRNWNLMSPDVAASNVGNSIVASALRNVTVLSKMSAGKKGDHCDFLLSAVFQIDRGLF